MRYGSVCSGIEAATAAWHPLGWTPAFFSEIEPFPRAVLAHHYPDTPCHGDFTTIEADQYGPIDLLVGGTPCQSFSIAGLRGGLDDDRGNLALEFLRLADRKRPRWLVWENVPGVLSSNGGRDFGAILGGMVELGYGIAYRVLDAQFFGVPQRRRRVFVVGCLGDWASAAAVLFERHSLSGHPAPRREKGQSAPTIPSRSTGGGGLGTDFDCDGGLIPQVCGTLATGGGGRAFPGTSAQDAGEGYLIPSTGDLAHCLNAGGMGRQDFETETLITQTATAFDTTQITSPGNFSNPKAGDPCHPLAAGAHPPAIAFAHQAGGKQTTLGYSDDGTCQTLGANQTPAVAFALRGREGGAMPEIEGDQVGALRAADGGSSRSYIATSAVRRLTPRECERLQGFPDNFTAIPWRGKPADACPDGPRYKALGNSMAVPVMRWIGERIQMVENLTKQQKDAA